MNAGSQFSLFLCNLESTSKRCYSLFGWVFSPQLTYWRRFLTVLAGGWCNLGWYPAVCCLCNSQHCPVDNWYQQSHCLNSFNRLDAKKICSMVWKINQGSLSKKVNLCEPECCLELCSCLFHQQEKQLNTAAFRYWVQIYWCANRAPEC